MSQEVKEIKVKLRIKDCFLFRLYRHSKWAFLLVVIFLFAWSVFACKKMDMLFLPRNDMFSHYESDSSVIFFYLVKKNKNPVDFIRFPYWKKELLEVGAGKYALYIHQQRKTSMQVYIERNVESFKSFENKLFPQKITDQEWFSWYMNYSESSMNPGDRCELIEYRSIIRNHCLMITDSSVITSFDY